MAKTKYGRRYRRTNTRNSLNMTFVAVISAIKNSVAVWWIPYLAVMKILGHKLYPNVDYDVKSASWEESTILAAQLYPQLVLPYLVSFLHEFVPLKDLILFGHKTCDALRNLP